MAHPASSDAAARLFTRAFIALGIAELAYFTANGLLIPLTPLFASEALGADPVGVGISVGAFSVTALLLRPFAGQAADRRGRRPLLVGGAFLFAAAVAAHALVDSLPALIGLRLVLGVAEAFFFVAGFAMVADLAPPGRAGEALSYNSLALYLGIAFGPAIGELLLQAGGYPLAWAGGAGMCVLAGILALGLPETAARGAPGPLVLLHPRALAPSIGLFTGIAGMSGFLAFVTLWARSGLDLDGAGPVLLLFGLVVVGTRVVFARLPDRVPAFRLAAAALSLTAAGLAVVGLVPTTGGLYAGAALTAIGVAFTTPAFFAAIVQRVAPGERGAALGTTSLFLDLAFGGGPMLFGFIVGGFDYPMAFLAAAAIAGVGAIGTAVGASRAGRA